MYWYRIVSFAELRATRRDRIVDTVVCPECGTQRELDEGNPQANFDGGQWRCDECAVAGYFPISITRGTVWDDEDEPQQIQAEDEVDDGALPAGEYRVDLDWMSACRARARPNTRTARPKTPTSRDTAIATFVAVMGNRGIDLLARAEEKPAEVIASLPA